MKNLKSRITVLAAATLLAACSGSGGSSSTGGTPTGQDAFLLLDSHAGGDDSLSGHLEILALERHDGSLTGNLLTTPVAVDLATPTGEPAVFRLSGLEGGVYSALHIRFRDTLEHHSPKSGKQSVRVEGRDHRFELEDSFEHRAHGSWLLLRHRSPVQLVDDGRGGKRWRPHLACRRSYHHELHGTEMELTSFDANVHSLTAMPHGGDRRVALTMNVPVSTVLTSSAQLSRLSTEEFFRKLAVGRRCRAWGSLDDRMKFKPTHIQVDDRGHGTERKVLGRVGFVDTMGGTFTLGVLKVLRGALAPKSIQVHASSAYIHRSGARHQPLKFGDLQKDTLVEVEWYGEIRMGSISATEISIEDSPSGHGASYGPEIEGQVSKVVPSQRAITIVRRKNDPLLLMGRPVTSVNMILNEGGLLYRADEGKVLVKLSEVRTGERIWVKSYRVDGNTVHAQVVRVRSANR